MRLSLRLLGLSAEVRWRLVGLVALLLAVTATYVGQGILIARALAGVLADQPVAAIIWPLGGVAALQVLRAWALAVREPLALRASGAVKQALRQQVTARLLQLGPGWLQRTRTGTLQSIVVDGVETLDPYVGRFLPQAVASVAGAVAVTAYLIVLDALVGMIVLACCVVAAVVPVVSERFFAARMAAWFRGYRGLYAENLDAVQGMATLKAFNASRRWGADLGRRAEAFCRDAVRLTSVVVGYVGAVAFVVGVGTAVAVGVGAVRLAGGQLTAAALLTILLLARECFRPLKDLESAYHAGYAAVPAATAVLALLDTEPEVADPTGPPPPAALAAPLSVTFDDVTFVYRDRDRPALDRFSLDVAPGERVAIVGRSGAGKTTVVSLLLRFFDPAGGRILVGGHDIRDLPLERLRALIAVVAQDTYLFHGTVRRNLALARPGATADELEAAAGAARAHDFITALPQGYDTVLGERGLKLSGGERQRIAIARALLADTPILVLDEATSSVDAANEAGIQQALANLTGGRTTLMIAHRLSTIRDADRVVVLDAGRVAEVGDHAALLSRQGAYAQLVTAQERRP